MKKSKLLLLGIALFVVVLTSCTKGRGKLINSWKIATVEAKGTLSDSIKNAMLSQSKLTFTKDGHVTGILQFEITDGTFALSNGGKNLVIKDETGTPYPFESTITGDELILDNKEMKMTFKKI